MSLVLIDGSSILTSCFFGTVPREYYMAKSPEEKKVYTATDYANQLWSIHKWRFCYV